MREDLRRIIEDNWEDIQELIIEKAEAEQKPKTIWDLKIGDYEKYYCIDSDGTIVQHMFDESFDEVNRDRGNAFLTREEAEFELERRRIEAIMKKYSKPFENGGDNYFLYFYNCTSIRGSFNSTFNYGLPCFASEEIALKVVEEIGEDRLKKYWFGVRDGKR